MFYDVRIRDEIISNCNQQTRDFVNMSDMCVEMNKGMLALRDSEKQHGNTRGRY